VTLHPRRPDLDRALVVGTLARDLSRDLGRTGEYAQVRHLELDVTVTRASAIALTPDQARERHLTLISCFDAALHLARAPGHAVDETPWPPSGPAPASKYPASSSTRDCFGSTESLLPVRPAPPLSRQRATYRSEPQMAPQRSLTTVGLADGKQRYLVAYDYGAGGLWGVLLARSEGEITRKYPELTIVHTRPPWMSDREYARMCEDEYDIDGAPRGLLNVLVADRERS
jgi:hypothetical protein